MSLVEMKRTERGWPGHLCVADRCRFRRNTLLEYGEIRVVVSTVGGYFYNGEYREIGYERHFESCAFFACWNDPYWDSDIRTEIPLMSNWKLKGVTRESDKLADEMHERVVSEMIRRILTGTVFDWRYNPAK